MYTMYKAPKTVSVHFLLPKQLWHFAAWKQGLCGCLFPWVAKGIGCWQSMLWGGVSMDQVCSSASHGCFVALWPGKFTGQLFVTFCPEQFLFGGALMFWWECCFNSNVKPSGTCQSNIHVNAPKVFPGYSFNLALVFMPSSQHRLFSIDFYSLSGTKIRVFVGRLGNRTAITCGSCKSAHTVHTGQYSQLNHQCWTFSRWMVFLFQLVLAIGSWWFLTYF